VATWQTHNPLWTTKVWSGNQIRELIVHANELEWLLPIYDKMTLPVDKSDLGRAVILYAVGGVYADLDMECFRSLDSLTLRQNVSMILVNEPKAQWEAFEAPDADLGIVSNSFSASVPGHPLWFAYFKRIAKFKISVALPMVQIWTDSVVGFVERDTPQQSCFELHDGVDFHEVDRVLSATERTPQLKLAALQQWLEDISRGDWPPANRFSNQWWVGSWYDSTKEKNVIEAVTKARGGDADARIFEPIVLRKFAEENFRNSRFNEASHYWDAALQLQPSYSALLSMRGELVYKSGQEDESMPFFRRVLALADTIQGGGREQEGKQQLTPTPREISVAASFLSGYYLERSGHTDEAEHFVRVAIAAEPSSAAGESLLGNVLMRSAPPRFAEALDCYDRSIDSDPSVSKTRLARGITRYLQDAADANILATDTALQSSIAEDLTAAIAGGGDKGDKNAPNESAQKQAAALLAKVEELRREVTGSASRLHPDVSADEADEL
jgi:tetratricopeptide (TPR) repeat protein